jgi:hypothetical protein
VPEGGKEEVAKDNKIIFRLRQVVIELAEGSNRQGSIVTFRGAH